MPTARAAVKHRMIRLASSAGKLRPSDIGLLARMTYMATKVLVLQSRRSLPDLIQAFDVRPGQRMPERIGLNRLVRLVDALMRVWFHDRYCMKRSLLLFHFLRGWGYDVRIHFGVAKVPEGLTGHAWVDLNGYPFKEASDPRATFTVTYSFPPVPPR